MVRNPLLLLLLIGVIVALCSIVSPAAAGRALLQDSSSARVLFGIRVRTIFFTGGVKLKPQEIFLSDPNRLPPQLQIRRGGTRIENQGEKEIRGE
ncbi:hypothetical protein TRIUR3_09335 [Triticum urartu]|uniref:Uncharacterized protein n=1 Tax=Triticum urartu TaxID=4572 RepID=M8A0G9_TRIUA|nr:hypothetical protein TRIUR3_09335 [Triticum urartu]